MDNEKVEMVAQIAPGLGLTFESEKFELRAHLPLALLPLDAIVSFDLRVRDIHTNVEQKVENVLVLRK